MYESPRDRRLKTDFQALGRLKSVSSIIDFKVFETPPQRYLVTFGGKGLWWNKDTNQVEVLTQHVVEIRLGASYPRNKPELKWKTPIFHPNISALGQVCLGGYGTNWVPSLNLDELCEMLWDMIRFANFDTKSPYNYKAARWVEQQTIYGFPLDGRSLRDQVTRERLEAPAPAAPQAPTLPTAPQAPLPSSAPASPPPAPPAPKAPLPSPLPSSAPSSPPPPPPAAEDGIVFIAEEAEDETPSAGAADTDILFIGDDD